VTDLRPTRPGMPLPQPSGARRPRSRLGRLLAPFGLSGRVVATAVFVAPLLWFATTDTIGVVGLPIWVLFVLPKALRAVWSDGSRAAGGRTYRILRRGPAATDRSDSDSIGGRAGPTRW